MSSISKGRVLSYEELVSIYKDYCVNVHINKINLGFPTLHSNFRSLRKQELLTILAKSGVGKSIIALNFAINFIECSDEIALIFSMEMSDFGIAERLMQIKLRMAGELIEKGFITKDPDLEYRALNGTVKFNNLLVVPDPLEIHQIPHYKKHIEETYKKKVGLIVCDHVGLLRNMFFPKGDYVTVTENMKTLYQYAKTLNVAIINVSQISREAAKQSQIGLHGGKGSGEIENSSDFVISVSAVTNNTLDGDESDKLAMIRAAGKQGLYRLLRIVTEKNRRGSESQNTYALFNTESIIVQEFSPDLL